MSVDYHEKPEIPGKLYFTCPSNVGTISKEFCADRHVKASLKENIQEHKFEVCRNCPLGGLHSGKKESESCSQMYGNMLCSRCERIASRLVGGRICISCFNRQAEVKKNKNSKGHPLTKIRQYRDIRLLTIKGNQVQVSTSHQVMTHSEAVLGTLHKSSEAVSFAWVGGGIQK